MECASHVILMAVFTLWWAGTPKGVITSLALVNLIYIHLRCLLFPCVTREHKETVFGKHLRRQRFVSQHEALVAAIRMHVGHMSSFMGLFRSPLENAGKRTRVNASKPEKRMLSERRNFLRNPSSVLTLIDSAEVTSISSPVGCSDAAECP